ncbi:MAG: putative DNA binding domain-containing protein, partial [Eggerthellaceae bacterium]|nr:putative DNA binding domain-containing protein [Eggerthellaceae bacterium]
MMKENKNLEFKLAVTNSFLKTVSAFSNYDGGKIIFGLNDLGEIIGIKIPKETCIDIENKINDSITPQPRYSLSLTDKEQTITLEVKPGAHKPYFYRSKAYKRNDTATIEVDNLELKRLILEGEEKNFEELPSHNQALEFNVLENNLQTNMGITSISQDILKTLELYSDEAGFNNAAALLADKNSFCGIDVAKFGDTISIFQKRLTLEHQSILKSYEETVLLYRDFYQYEIIDGVNRRSVETVPENAFREALANAIIHREWDISAHIRVSMFDDRIEISSVGGLPRGINEESFLEGQISILRNPIIANVFHRLNLVEKFG